MVNKKESSLLVKVIISLTLFVGCLLVNTMGVLAETNKGMDTPAGIEFKKRDNTTPTQSSAEPTLPKDTSIKKGGMFPNTGELVQPIIFMLIGCLLFILIVSIYFSSKGNKKGEI